MTRKGSQAFLFFLFFFEIARKIVFGFMANVSSPCFQGDSGVSIFKAFGGDGTITPNNYQHLEFIIKPISRINDSNAHFLQIMFPMGYVQLATVNRQFINE